MIKGPYTASIKTDEPIAKMAMTVLVEAYPRAMRLEELLGIAAERLGRAAQADDRESLGKLALAGFSTHVVELHTWQSSLVGRASECPQASLVARYQATRGWEITTLWHERFAVANPVARKLIAALDGQHDRAALIEQLLTAIAASGLNLSGTPATSDPNELHRQVAERLEGVLTELARSALLIG